MDLSSLKISEIRDYFSIWRNDMISLHDYIRLREGYAQIWIPRSIAAKLREQKKQEVKVLIFEK